MEIRNKKQEFWMKHRQAYELQDLSIIEYCKRENLNTYTFKYYREKFLKEQKLRNSNMEATEPSRFVRIQPSPESKGTLKHSVSGAQAPTVVAQLVVAHGIRLECFSWPDPSWLLRINREVLGD